MSDSDKTTTKKGFRIGALILGVAIAMISPIGIWGIMSLTVFMGSFILYIGVFQWVYLLPIIFFFRKRSRSLIQGLLIGGGVVFLLNASCFGWFYYSHHQAHGMGPWPIFLVLTRTGSVNDYLPASHTQTSDTFFKKWRLWPMCRVRPEVAAEV